MWWFGVFLFSFALGLVFFFSQRLSSSSNEIELIWGNLSAGLKVDDHMRLTVLINDESIYLWKAPYIKLFFPGLYR